MTGLAVGIPSLVSAANSSRPAAAARTTVQPGKHPQVDPIEARINALHDELQITEPEAGQWDGVAGRCAATPKRSTNWCVGSANRNTMTAVDDLRAYQEITEAHAKGVKKLVAAFEVLYGTMSDDQKKMADGCFASTSSIPWRRRAERNGVARRSKARSVDDLEERSQFRNANRFFDDRTAATQADGSPSSRSRSRSSIPTAAEWRSGHRRKIDYSAGARFQPPHR